VAASQKDQLSGQMFDELDLAYAVMNGVKAREKEAISVQNVLNLTIIAELKIYIVIIFSANLL